METAVIEILFFTFITYGIVISEYHHILKYDKDFMQQFNEQDVSIVCSCSVSPDKSTTEHKSVSLLNELIYIFKRNGEMNYPITHS